MLVMRRRQGDAILIGDDVEIRILSIDRNRVKVGITAPRTVRVSAREIELVRTENRAAALTVTDAPGLVARLLQAREQGGSPQETPAIADSKDKEPEDPCPA